MGALGKTRARFTKRGSCGMANDEPAGRLTLAGRSGSQFRFAVGYWQK
jgi:hypothetical protein